MPKLSQLPNGFNQTKLFPVVFIYFNNFATGKAISLYWTIFVILYTFFEGTYKQFRCMADAAIKANANKIPCLYGSDDKNTIIIDAGQGNPAKVRNCIQHFGMDMLPPFHYCGNRKVMAHNMCQSIEYFLQMNSGYVGTTIILPLVMVVRNCQIVWETDTNRERAWVG